MPANQVAAVDVLSLTLPFVGGVPAERLCELREKMPDVFRDFRGEMLSIVEAGMKDGPEAGHFLATRVDRAVRPKLRQLEGEISGALVKARILGTGIPLITGMGVLAGRILGIPTEVLLTMGVGGAFAGLTTAAEYSASHSRMAAHPFYFLWKATR